MTGLFAAVICLFAQQAEDGGQVSIWIVMLQFLPIILLGYFLLIRPQQQEQRRRREMVEAIEKDDRVETIGGIFGTVVSVDKEADTVLLRVDDDRNVRVVFRRASISRVVKSKEEKPAK